MDSVKNKVAVHCEQWVTESGHLCLKSWEFWVVVGPVPVGPRGGKCGRIVDGYRVAGRFSSYEKAFEFAQKYAQHNGFEII